MLSLILSFLMDPAVMASLAAGLGGLVWFLVSRRSAKAQANFALAARLASQVVHEIARRTPTPLDDLLDVFLAEIAKSLEAQGQVMKPADVDAAKKLFVAMHGGPQK